MGGVRGMRVLLAGAGVVLAGSLLATDQVRAADQAPVEAPGVIAFSGSSSGLELYAVAGQYHPSFDQQFIVSVPEATASADSGPSAAATATPLDPGQFAQNYTNAACVVTVFAPYCDYIQRMPLDTYFARAASDNEKDHDASTDFPCRPGLAEPPSAAVAPPDSPCPKVGGSPGLVAGDGFAHADRSPRASAEARVGAISVLAPPGTMDAYKARLRLARRMLAAEGRDTGRVAAAEKSGIVLSARQILATSSFVVGPDGYPTSHQSVRFEDVDALGGLLHADSLVLDVVARTLGESRPPVMAETMRVASLVVTGRMVGDLDAKSCQSSIDQINGGSGAAGRLAAAPPGLNAFGFRLSCGLDASRVETDPAKGFGLNPIQQELIGPGIDFLEPVRPLEYLPSDAPMPPLCYPNKNVPAPPPPPALPALPTLPVPAPQPPSSSCQFFSSDSLANNAFGLRLGHLRETLAAQRTASTLTDAVGGAGPGAALVSGGGSPAGSDAGVTAPSSGLPGAANPVAPHRPRRPAGVLTGAGVRLPDWIVFAYGAWGSWGLATLAVYGALLHHRRLRGGAR
jgi:hypothetical protein